MPPASSSGGASRSTSPILDVRLDPSSERQPSGSSSPWARASARALLGETGQPLNTTVGPVTSSVHDSSTCPTWASVGRFSTTPTVPSSGSSSTTRITARRKLGSPSSGVATSSRAPGYSATVERAGPLRLGDLAAAERIAPSTLTRLVSVLEDHGYVQRRAVPGDARAWTLVVTARGHEVLDRIRQENTILLADSLLTLSPDQLAALAAALPALEQLASTRPRDPEA